MARQIPKSAVPGSMRRNVVQLATLSRPGPLPFFILARLQTMTRQISAATIVISHAWTANQAADPQPR